MSTADGQSFGPCRPVPIHLVPPSLRDSLGFRQPLPMDKPARPVPPLWNPALDICPSSNKDKSPDKDMSSSSTKHALLSRARPSTSRPMPSAAPTSVKRTSAPDAPNVESRSKALTGSPEVPTELDPTLFERLHRHLPGAIANPLSVLASKGLFPVLQATAESPLVPTLINGRPGFPLALVQRHLALQNALTFVHSRAVMEQIASTRPQIPRLAHVPSSHSQIQLHHCSQTHTQPAVCPPSSMSNVRPTAPPSESRPSPLHTALAQAQSRALLERLGTAAVAATTAPPALSLDTSMAQGYGRKLFPCPQCRYTTDRRNNLKRHMLTMHQISAKLLECCGILFNTKASLREHAMVFHYHGYTCYFCGRRFCRKALLKRHLSVHNGQKDFVCNVCDYATSHKSNLERHRKVHSRQEEGREGEEGPRYADDDVQHYHDDVRSNGSEALSHDDVSSDDLSVCSDYDDDIDVEINVHSD